jgi:hypothetical protein
VVTHEDHVLGQPVNHPPMAYLSSMD